jgi:peptidoglycan hydrolase-like protein with peptidoglycan-binding domain
MPARGCRYPVSTYHWLLPESVRPIKEQVRTYADLLRDYPHDFVPWLDYEGEAAPRDLLRYLDLFHETADRSIGVYSSFARLEDAACGRLHPSDCGSRGIPAFPGLGPSRWDFWQFTENMPGKQFGFPEDGEQLVDMNYFNGTPETFRAFCDPQQAGTPEQQLKQRIEWEVPRPPLSPGDTGIQVLKLQDLLVRCSFMTSAQVSVGPGIFGPRTRAAFMNMQAALGLPPSGLYDAAARSAVIARYYTLESAPPIEVTPPSPVPDDKPLEERPLFDGNAVYRRYIARLDRGQVQYHVLKVDLTNAEVFITPQPSSLTMVPEFLRKYRMDIAINGDGWTRARLFGFPRIQTTGENASRGKVYGRRENQASFYIDQRNRVSTRRPASRDIWNALSFPNLLVEDGQSSPASHADIDPRTLGFSQDGRCHPGRGRWQRGPTDSASAQA